jgi:hypothetical protein
MSAMTLTVADQVNALTFRNKIKDIRLGDAARGVLTRYRMRLRDAERFVVDDDAVRLVCQLSKQRDRLAGWSCLARLPYDITWIEFNLHEKCREFMRIGTITESLDLTEVSPLIGYLMYRDGAPGTARWLAHPFYQADDMCLPGLLAFLFDPEGQPDTPLRGSSVWNSPTLSLRHGFPRIPAVSPDGSVNEIDGEILLAGDFLFEGNIGRPNEWFVNRGGAIVDPFWEAHHTRRRDRLNQSVALHVKEEAGIIRWLVTLLASINNLPKDIRDVPTSTRTRVAHGHRLALMSHRTISIKLPRDDRVVRARELLDNTLSADPRPWHKVIGHWRVIERGKMRGRVCRHIPTMVENGVAICERCELLVRWVSDYERGDHKIGVIEHTYAITGPATPVATPKIN